MFIQVDGRLSPGLSDGTLSLQDDLILAAASQLDYELGTPGVEGGANNDLVNVAGDLILDGMLNLSPFNFGGKGDYTLLSCAGDLTDNGLAIGTIPAGDTPNQFIIDVSVPTKVLLRVVPELVSGWLAGVAAGWLMFGHIVAGTRLAPRASRYKFGTCVKRKFASG